MRPKNINKRENYNAQGRKFRALARAATRDFDAEHGPSGDDIRNDH